MYVSGWWGECQNCGKCEVGVSPPENGCCITHFAQHEEVGWKRRVRSYHLLDRNGVEYLII